MLLMRNNIIPQIVSVQSIAFKPASREGKEKKKVSLKKKKMKKNLFKYCVRVISAYKLNIF